MKGILDGQALTEAAQPLTIRSVLRDESALCILADALKAALE